MVDTHYDIGTPSIEVTIYRGDELVARELCESEEEAALVVETWTERGDFSFEINDLTEREYVDDFEPAIPDIDLTPYPDVDADLVDAWAEGESAR